MTEQLDTVAMRACAPLLPEPGHRVVIQCLDEIERLRAELKQVTEERDWFKWRLDDAEG